MRSKLWSAVSGVVLAGLLGSPHLASAAEKPPILIGKGKDVPSNVLWFAYKNRGKKVGGGECTDLVNAALEYAGGKQISIRPAAKKEIDNAWSYKDAKGANVFYEWGKYHAAISLVRTTKDPVLGATFDNQVIQVEEPRDVAQLERRLTKPSARLNRTYHLAQGEIIQFEGAEFEKPDKSTMTMPHHTAIVNSNAEGSTVWLIHQNYGGDGTLPQDKQDKTVRQDKLDLTWLKKGHYRVYTPVAK